MSDFCLIDLGAHDGFVTQFIARQARNSGVDIRVDAVEANPEGVRLFNERAQAEGIEGRCTQDLVERSHIHFASWYYDAVVAYELIEHAVDVDAFLGHIELHCRPGGRVYISTPNGTFGAGQNPHHLRVWNIVELFDILRRRGKVHNALAGPDGVSVLSYTPLPSHDRQDIAIYAGPGWEKWSPNDIESKGLGGSETAAARLAEALAADGHIVTVYGEVDPGAVGQVIYRHHSSFDPMDERDLLIVSRIPEVFEREVKARRSLLWLHDVDCGPRLKSEYMDQIDRIMCLSQWHYAHLLDTYKWLEGSQLYITRNGIEPSYFRRSDVPRDNHKALYTSSPDRGLDFLLSIWWKVRERIPDAELHYCYSSVYDAVAAKDPRIAAFRDRVRTASGQPGVYNAGALAQPKVAELMLSAGVWLAPSYSSPAGERFCETFCIGAIESAAAGCARVMSDWGALPERDEGDVSWWIDSEDDLPVVDKWVDAIVNAMGCEHHLPARAALDMDWAEVAADMLAAAG